MYQYGSTPDKLVEWADEWLVKINSSKCKAMSVWYQRRSENVNVEYTIRVVGLKM